MNFTDALAAASPEPPRRPRPTHPKGYEPTVRYEAGEPAEVSLNLTVIPEDEQAWRDEIARVFPGLPIPEYRRVEVDNLRYWGDPGSPMIYVRFKITDRQGPAEAFDFLSLMEAAKAAVIAAPVADRTAIKRATVVGYADPQTGKVASRGGTPELLERVAEKLALLDGYSREMGSDAAYLLDAGDAIEGFENVSSQMHTNDLSLPRQIEVASDILFEFTRTLAATHPEVVVAGVGSNHCRWRAGKGALGLPGDDWGIHMLRQLAKALKLNPAFDHVSVTWPNDHDETLALDVAGTIVGLAHGHQATRPDGVPLWWAKQVHGGQNLAHAQLLFTGHFHAFRTQSTGRDPFKDREKRWFQCPTLDNGSDWYRAIAGEDSDTGLLVMTVDENGWDNLRLL